MKKIKLLFIGSFLANSFVDKKKPNKELTISGTVISLKNTYEKITEISKKYNLEIIKFDSDKFRYNKKNKSIRNLFIYLISSIVRYIKLIYLTTISDKTLINSSPHGIAYLTPVTITNFILRKSSVIRVFGGREPLDVNLLLRPLVFLSLNLSSSVGIQAKSITKKYNSLLSTNKFFWLPTSRPRPDQIFINERKSLINKSKKELLYLGHIRKDKGIDFLIEAFNEEKLQNYNLHLYGPLWGQLGEKESYSLKKIRNSKNITYKGTIESKDAYKLISKYDALIFPTISPAEGYPGVIIEALLVGTPVIASKWLHLKEILNKNNSILFKPFSHKAIVNAVLSYYENSETQVSLNIGALKSSKDIFCLDRQTYDLLNYLGLEDLTL